MTQKLNVTAEDIALAAFNHANALSAHLIQKGLLTIDEANEIAATAASMCKASGGANAAEVIYRAIPSCRNVDPVAAAEARGAEISRPE